MTSKSRLSLICNKDVLQIWEVIQRTYEKTLNLFVVYVQLTRTKTLD